MIFKVLLKRKKKKEDDRKRKIFYYRDSAPVRETFCQYIHKAKPKSEASIYITLIYIRC